MTQDINRVIALLNAALSNAMTLPAVGVEIRLYDRHGAVLVYQHLAGTELAPLVAPASREVA